MEINKYFLFLSSSSLHVKILYVLVFLNLMCWAQVYAAAKPPAIFIFGDSTVDVGTNSYLPQSNARADFPYYGIDFPRSRPTGRFSNGFNGADLLAKLMGYNSSPRPFFSFGTPLNSYLRNHAFRGASFASAGSGILDFTGSALIVVPLSEQIKQFATLQQNLTAVRGLGATEAMLRKSLFFISIGSNDILDYVQSNSTLSPAEFITILINTYEDYIKALYSIGARKFGILSVPPIGCCPAIRVSSSNYGNGGCSEPMNELARAFFSALDTLLYDISSDLQEMNYSLGNAYAMTIDVINNPEPFNFEVKSACCGFGRLNAELPCNATANLCSNRREYLFWDQFHPTQAAARLAANTLYAGPIHYVSPINLSQLVQDY